MKSFEATVYLGDAKVRKPQQHYDYAEKRMVTLEFCADYIDVTAGQRNKRFRALLKMLKAQKDMAFRVWYEPDAKGHPTAKFRAIKKGQEIRTVFCSDCGDSVKIDLFMPISEQRDATIAFRHAHRVCRVPSREVREVEIAEQEQVENIPAFANHVGGDERRLRISKNFRTIAVFVKVGKEFCSAHETCGWNPQPHERKIRHNLL